MRAVCSLLFFAGLLMHWTTGHAEVVTYARHGSWSAYGGKSNDGTPVCGVSAAGSGKSFHLKYFRGNSHVTIQMFNKQWTGRSGMQVAVKMAFDDNSPWTANATSSYDSQRDLMLEFNIPFSKTGLWIQEFKDSYSMRLEFPGSSTSAWSVDLTGTTEISQKFGLCLNVMSGNAG